MRKFLSLFLLVFLAMMKTVPSFASAPGITGPDVIYKQQDKFLVMSQILPLYSSTDGSIIVKDDLYTGNGDMPGIYPVTLGVHGTEITKSIEINVRQTIGDVIAVTRTGELFTIHVYKNVTLNTVAIRDILVRVQYIQVTSQTQMHILTNDYTENANSPGNYVYEFRLITTSGIETFHTINIKVSNSDELTPDDVLSPDPTPGQSLATGFLVVGGIFAGIMIIAAISNRKSKKKGGK